MIKSSPRRAHGELGISGRIARAFITAQLTPLLAIFGLLLGVFAVLVTPKEEEPQINVTMANVLIPFPAASTEDVHNLVTVPAEQVVSQITGIDHGLFAAGAEQALLAPALTTVLITDSVAPSRVPPALASRVHVVSAAPLLAATIKALHRQ